MFDWVLNMPLIGLCCLFKCKVKTEKTRYFLKMLLNIFMEERNYFHSFTYQISYGCIKNKMNWFLTEAATGVITKDVLKNFAKFTEKHLCWSLILIKLQAQDLQPKTCNFIKKDSSTGVFLLNIIKFLKTCLLQNTPPGDCFLR